MSDPMTLARASGADDALGTAPPKRKDFLTHWRRRAEAMAASRDRILTARDLETGTLCVTSPDAQGGDDPYSSRIPQRWQVPLHLEQQIADLLPDILVEPQSGSEQATATAQKKEACLRALIEQQLPWRDAVGKAVREAEWAAYLLPASAAWERRCTWMDAQAKEIRRAWWRDADSQPTTERGQVDTGRSYRAYREASTQYKEQHYPATYRLISALDCVPTFTRGYGRRRWELSSLMVRTLYDVEELLADGYRWDGMDRMLIPTGFSEDNLHGAHGQAYLYEWFYYRPDERDPDQRVPMVSYSVAGMDTWNGRMQAKDDDDPAEATVDLRKQYGLYRHLMSYYWGFQRSGEDDPGRKGIPLMTILEDTILGIERLVMATKKHADESAFRGYQFVPDPGIPAEAYTQGTDGGRTMRQFPLPGSGEGVSVPGEWRPVAPAPMGQVVTYLIESERKQLELTTPDPSQYGGGGAESGHELSVSHALFQSAHSHIKEGLRQQVEDLAEWNLELADRLIDHFDLEGLPITSNQPLTVGAPPGSSAPKQQLLLTRGMIGGSYDVTAFYPAVGNLAEVAQENALRKDGMSTFDRVAEKMGVNDPFSLRVEVARDQYLASPAGQALQAIWLARYRGDDEAAQKLIDAGALNPDGQTPTSAIDPEAMAAAGGAVARMQGGPPPGAMPAGPGGPMPGESAMGGVIAGGLGSGPMQADAQAVSAIQQAPQARMAGG